MAPPHWSSPTGVPHTCRRRSAAPASVVQIRLHHRSRFRETAISGPALPLSFVREPFPTPPTLRPAGKSCAGTGSEAAIWSLDNQGVSFARAATEIQGFRDRAKKALHRTVGPWKHYRKRTDHESTHRCWAEAHDSRFG